MCDRDVRGRFFVFNIVDAAQRRYVLRESCGDDRLRTDRPRDLIEGIGFVQPVSKITQKRHLHSFDSELAGKRFLLVVGFNEAPLGQVFITLWFLRWPLE